MGDVVFSTNGHTQMTAQRFPSTRVNIALPIYEMLELTGGVRTLVFLFSLLELPMKQVRTSFLSVCDSFIVCGTFEYCVASC